MIRFRALVLALALAPLGALAQPAAPLTAEAAETPPPAANIDLAYPAQEGATVAPAETDPVQLKIQQVNQALDQAANPEPPAATEQTQPAEWSPLENSMRAMFGLLAALALLLFLYYLAKRFGKNSPLFAGSDLARVMGKVYLAPRASLHFVKSGGRVLVLGVTPNAISTVAEFDADAFAPTTEEAPASTPAAGSPSSETESFLAQFKASLDSIAHAAPAESPGQDDAEIAALREDVQRLQRFLQESVRGGENP